MVEIIQQENKILRKLSKSIPMNEIKNDKTRKVLAEMKDALDSQEDGVAIAAPQIGISLQVFLVSKRAFEVQSKETDSEYENDSKNEYVFINPEIIKISKKKVWLEEGCLSVRWLYGDVKRSTNVTIRAYNEKGEKFTRGAGGLLAQIFQHETDHLNGILFIDKAKNIEEILPSDE